MITLCQLAEKQSYWENIARSIVGDPDIAKDIVQDAYIKVHNKNITHIRYFYLAIRSVAFDYIKRNKYCQMPDNLQLPDNVRIFEPNDTEAEILEKFDQLSWVQKELISEISTGRSYREIQDIYDINYIYTYRQVCQAKQILLAPAKD